MNSLLTPPAETRIVYPASWIEKTPGVCGGSARVRRTRIPVWLLVEARDRGATDADLACRFEPPLSPDDLAAAWAYALLHPDEIARDRWQNEACMVEADGDVPLDLVREGFRLGFNDAEIREAFEPPLSREAFDAARARLRADSAGRE